MRLGRDIHHPGLVSMYARILITSHAWRDLLRLQLFFFFILYNKPTHSSLLSLFWHRRCCHRTMTNDALWILTCQMNTTYPYKRMQNNSRLPTWIFLNSITGKYSQKFTVSNRPIVSCWERNICNILDVVEKWIIIAWGGGVRGLVSSSMELYMGEDGSWWGSLLVLVLLSFMRWLHQVHSPLSHLHDSFLQKLFSL